jgi:hypothetical protein
MTKEAFSKDDIPDAAAFRRDMPKGELTDDDLAQIEVGPKVNPRKQEQRLREYFEAFPKEDPEPPRE